MSQSASSRRSNNKLGSSMLAIAGLAGLALLGTSLAPTVNASTTYTFGSIESPGSIISGVLRDMVPKPPSMLEKYLVPGLVNVTSAGVSVNSSTRVIVKATASLLNPFGPVTLPLGQVGVKVHLDGISLVNITTSDLTLGAGIAPLNVTATIDVAEGAANPALQASINNLATNLLGVNTPSGEAPKLVISGVSLGGTDAGLDPITIPVTPILSSGPIQKPAGGAVAPQPGVPPVVGITDIINPNATLTWPVLNKVVLKAISGNQITAGVGFSWNNPLNIEVDIPYISVDIGFNGTRVLTVGVQAIHLAPGNMTAETLIDLKFNNDPVAAGQLGAFVNDFLAGTLHSVINIGNIQFGTPGDGSAAGTLLNSLLSGLSIDLPLSGLSTVAIKDLVLSYIQPYLPIDIGKVGASAPSLLSYVKSLALSTAPGHTLLIEPKVQLPFPFLLDLNIPYFALDINLDNNLLGQLLLVNLVGSGQGQIDVSVGVGIVFKEPSPTIPGSISKLVNGLTTAGSSLDILAGVSNIAVGLSPTDAITTLSAINVALPISSVITGHINTGDLISGIMDQINITLLPNAVAIKLGTLAELTIYEANIAVLPNNLVTAGINLDVFLGLPVVANIGYFGVQLTLDGANLAGVDLTSGLNYAGGRVQMNAGVSLSIGTGPAISANVANLVNAVLAKQPVTSVVGISGITLGHTRDDTIGALSELALSLPLGGLFGGTALPTPPTGFLENLIAQLGLSLTDLSLATIPGAGLQVGAKASFANPIPITLSVPFIGISGGLDKIDIVNIGVNNVALMPGPNAFQAGIDLNFNNAAEAQSKVATFVGGILGGQLGSTPEALTVHNLRIGTSPSDYFDLLSQIDIAIPSKVILNQANVDFIIGKLGLNTTSLIDNVLNSLQIGGITADLNKAPVIDLGATVSVSNFALTAAVNIGYVGIDIALDSHALAHVDVPSITITTANNQLTLAIQASITVQDTPEIQTDVANLVGYFLKNGTASPINAIVISKPLLGVSGSDNIQTFSQIQYPLAVPPLLVQAKALVDKLLTSLGGLNLNSLGISGLVVDLNAPQTIGIDASIALKNISIPADIKLNYVGVNIGLDNVGLAQVEIPSLTLKSDGSGLAITAHIDVALLSTPALTKTINELITGVLNNQTTPATNVIISGAVFGGSPTNIFKLLQSVVVPINIAPYINQIGGMLGGASSLLDGLGLSGLAINLNEAPVIGVDANIAVRNLALPATLKLNYVGLGIGINGVSLVDVAIPKLVFGTSGPDLTIGTHVDVTLKDTDAAQTLVAELVNTVVAGQTPQGTIVVSNIAFGGSKTNVFTFLQDVQVSIPIAKILSLLPATPGTNATSILNQLSLQSADINMKNPPRIGADIAIALLGYQFDAQLLLNYVGISAFLDSTPLASIDVPGIKLNSGNNQIALAVNALVQLGSGSEIQGKVAAIVAQVLGTGPGQDVNLVVSKILFGDSASNSFHILDKVKVSVPLTPYIEMLAKFVGDLLGGGGALPAGAPAVPAIDIKNLAISDAGANALSIALSASIGGIGSKISVAMPYVGLEVTAGGAGLVNPTINNLQLVNGNLDLTLSLPFADSAKSFIGSLSTPVSQLMFSTVGTVTGSIVANNIRFGASPSQAFDIASAVKVEIQLNDVLQAAQTYINAHNPLHVNDMNTILTTTGIKATIVVPGIPLSIPLKMNFPITLSGYHKGNRMLAIQATTLSLGQSPWSIGAEIAVVQPGFGTAMNSILPNALQWKNALQDVTLGGVTLGSFTALNALTITPPEVTLWSPITVPLDKLRVHLLPLGMDFTAQFTNQGPLQVDVGTVNIIIVQGNNDVISISSLGGPIHINNGNQTGGLNSLSLNASLKFNILQLFGILAQLLNPSGFKFVFNMRTSSGEPMPWLQDALNSAPAAIFNNLLPILAKALGNVRFTL
ncbi:hypothetical protein BG004_002617 [Podila humilis]|nr:hypothetical protein BG004_002617 [Podila humilis]